MSADAFPSLQEAASSQKGKKKTKGKTFHLSEFTAPAGTSWADEPPLPTGPSQEPSSGYDSRPSGGFRDGNRDGNRDGGRDSGRDRFQSRDTPRDDPTRWGRAPGETRPSSDYGNRDRDRDSDRPSRSEQDGWRDERRANLETFERKGYQIDKSAQPPRTDLPSNPPFKAFLGNLPFSIQDDDIKDLFKDCKIIDIQAIKDRETGRPKGFAYIEFAEVADLEKALQMNGALLQGRTVRVDLAESRGDRGDRSSGSGDWRTKSTTGEDRPPRDSAPRSNKSDEVDDWRKRDESRVPTQFESRPSREGGFQREGREGGFQREGREGGFQREGREGGFQREGREGGFQRDSYRREGGFQQREGREGGFQQREGGFQREGREGGFQQREGGFQREGREGGYQNRQRGGFQPPEETSAADLSARKKLELKPKSSDAKPTLSQESRPAKSDPFGGAKPRDEAEIQRRLEERKKQGTPPQN